MSAGELHKNAQVTPKGLMSVILALDPGTNNYGYAVVSVQPNHKPRVMKSGRIHTTVRALNHGVLNQIREHSKVIKDLITHHRVTHVIVERYMSRRMGGTTIEAVNIMIGMIMQLCADYRLYCICIPASQWKNEVNRNNPGYLDEEYKLGRPHKITPHTIDAATIAVYGMGKMRQFNPFASHMKQGKVINLLTDGGPIADLGEQPPKKKKRKRRAKA